MSNGLAKIAHDINAHHKAATQSAVRAVEHARDAGRLLIEAKASVDHGDWLDWLANHFEGAERTAYNYVSVAKNWENLIAPKLQSSANLSVDGALKLITAKSAKSAEGWDTLAKPVQKAIEDGEVKAKPKEVDALAEYDKASQKAIVESVAKGEAKSITEAISAADPDPEEEEDVASPVDLAISQAPEFEAQRRTLNAMKKWVEEEAAGPGGHLLRAEGKSIIRHLENARHAILYCKPHCACPYCGGVVDDDELTACGGCKGRGWVSKDVAEHAPK